MGKSLYKQVFELHSDIRLPFEPKGEALVLKEKIRRNVKLLKPSEYNHLNARLSTNEKAFFDVENILFYNVGSGAFSHLILDEVSFALVRDSNNLNNKFTYSYELTSGTSKKETNNIILEFGFEMEKITSDIKPIDYWQALNQGEVLIAKLVNPVEFGLTIVIETPKKYRNITSLIKPMIDGIISSFHYQNSVNRDVLNYISKKKHISNDVALSQFNQKKYTFLDERNLTSIYRNGIKWNPEDEKCTKVNIRQIRGTDRVIKVHGNVFSI